MKSVRNTIVFASLALAITAGIWLVGPRHEPAANPAPPPLQSHASPQKVSGPAPEISPAPLAAIPSAEQSPALAKTKVALPPAKLGSTSTNALAHGPSGKKKEVLDPVAREALIYVGADPDAETYWFGAINDPTLPPNERQDLIEDLNEEGLSDPKHPSPEDLPLILSRLELIELLGPYAMDEVNFNAFAEAYKDLMNLAWVAGKQ